MSGIRLSKKHGVNPSMGLCFWCGEDDGTVLLVGRLPNDAEAPRRMLASYEPCAKCKEKFALRIRLVEVKTEPTFDKQPPLNRDPDLYPTGRWCVARPEAVERIFTPDVSPSILKHRAAFLEPEVFAIFAIKDKGEQK